MQWIAMIFPAFVAVIVSEVLEKKKYSGVDFFKYAGAYGFFSNFITVLVFQYVLKLSTPILTSFENNLFLIHFMEINLFCAVVLPVLKLALNPHLHIRVENRKAGKGDADTNEKKNEEA